MTVSCTIMCSRWGSEKHIATFLMSVAKALMSGESDLRQRWQRISSRLKKQTDTCSLHCSIEYRYKIRQLVYCVDLRSNRPLKGMKGKVRFPIMAQLSVLVGSIELEMGGCRVQGRKRKIKSGHFYHTKENRKKPKHHLLCYKMFRLNGEHSESRL